MEFLDLRMHIYPTLDLNEAKKWWKNFLGIDPYFDGPFYVEFNVDGCEIGLNPRAAMKCELVTCIGIE